jgi:hypothetical protein
MLTRNSRLSPSWATSNAFGYADAETGAGAADADAGGVFESESKTGPKQGFDFAGNSISAADEDDDKADSGDRKLEGSGDDVNDRIMEVCCGRSNS